MTLQTYAKGIEQEDQLKAQLQQKLDNKDSRMNRCTYNDLPKSQDKVEDPEKGPSDKSKGYLYQLVYSCRTCYNEQIVDALTELAKEVTPAEAILEVGQIAKLEPRQMA